MRSKLERQLSVYKTKHFGRSARKARISDSELWATAEQAADGRIDADLGGGVIKQRIARAGEGRSGGSRGIFVFRFQNRAVFAAYLNKTPGLISKWERGEKHPQGTSLKLLSLIEKKGLDLIA